MQARAAICLLLLAASVRAQDLPAKSPNAKPADDAQLFIDPPISLLPPGGESDTPQAPLSATDVDVQKARVARDRAQAKSQRWALMQKNGVLSKTEAERAQLQASQANMKYEQANAAFQRSQVEALRTRKAAPELIAAAEAALQTAETLAADATASWKKTQLALAEVNVARHRALAANGLESKDNLRRAEVELAKLRTEGK